MLEDLNNGDKKGMREDIEKLIEDKSLEERRKKERMRGWKSNGMKMWKKKRKIIGRMLEIEKKKVI